MKLERDMQVVWFYISTRSFLSCTDKCDEERISPFSRCSNLQLNHILVDYFIEYAYTEQKTIGFFRVTIKYTMLNESSRKRKKKERRKISITCAHTQPLAFFLLQRKVCWKNKRSVRKLSVSIFV